MYASIYPDVDRRLRLWVLGLHIDLPMERQMSLPTDYNARKALPVYTFLTTYFPDAIIELVKVSVAGNVQHNPGEPMHWSRHKSTDQLNTAMRHIFDHGAGRVYDTEPKEVLAEIGPHGAMHLAKAAWRLLAEIQLICEQRDSQKVAASPVHTLSSTASLVEGFVNGDIRGQERPDAPGLGQGARVADNAGGHPQRSIEGSSGGQASQLRSDGKAPF
jgi:hypothetical protein